jgi:DNA-binding NarL/FixJ family response regulator
LVQGKSNQQIAEAMSVSEHTVKMHMAASSARSASPLASKPLSPE